MPKQNCIDSNEQLFYNCTNHLIEGVDMHFVQAKSILTPNSMNIYRGCQHGCIYCDARSRCYQMDHVFEDIEVKQNAPILLEQALKSGRKPRMIGTGAMSDPYIPLERQLQLTRRCMELVDKYGYGFTLLTKSDLVLRDLDLLCRINHKTKAVVQMTITTMDDELCRILEPGVCVTSRRLEVLAMLKDSGIPTVVWMCPLMPFLNDTMENVLGIVDACADAGVKGIIQFGMGLTLRDGNREYCYKAFDKYFKGLKERYIRTYQNAYELPSPNERLLAIAFHDRCEQLGIWHDNDTIFHYLNTLEDKHTQLSFL